MTHVKLVAILVKVLKCPRQMMNAKKIEDIYFFCVPSLSMMKHRKAFLNEKSKSASEPDGEGDWEPLPAFGNHQNDLVQQCFSRILRSNRRNKYKKS